MPHVAFFHGWAGHPADWDPIITHLRSRISGVPFSYECPDSGYWGPARPWSGQRPDIIVGYSLGCFDAASLAVSQGCPWIAVNGFTRFTHAPDFAEGIPPRLLTRMQTQLQKAPLATVNAFRQRIEAPLLPPHAPYQTESLLRGLQRLLTEDHRSYCPQSAIVGQFDPLISQSHSRACFNNAIDLVPGGHTLLTTHAQDVATCLEQSFL